MPLSRPPKAKTSTRPAPASSTAGALACRRSMPAPALRMPAAASTASVSRSPASPQSSTWLFASTQQSIAAAASTGTLPGCMR
jgi:hypothetical protein